MGARARLQYNSDNLLFRGITPEAAQTPPPPPHRQPLANCGAGATAAEEHDRVGDVVGIGDAAGGNAGDHRLFVEPPGAKGLPNPPGVYMGRRARGDAPGPW